MDDGGSTILNRILIAATTAAAMVLMLWGPVVAQPVDGPYYIHATEVNLREAPNGEIILVLDVNDKVFVVERQGNWSYVSAPGREARGWCWSDYYGEGRIDPPAAGVCTDEADDGSVEIKSAPPAAVEDEVVVSDESVSSGSPVAVVDGYVPDELPVCDIMDTPQHNAAYAPPPVEAATPVDPAAEDEERLVVFSAGSLGAGIGGLAGDGVHRSAESFIPDENDAVPAADLAPAPVVTQDQPFQKPPSVPASATITTPAMLESAIYKPVGGHDIALIQGDNVNVRADRNLKSDILGRVDTGDKLYVIGYDDPWYHVSIPAKELKGYVYGQYVSELPRIEITGTEVRLREEPSTSARIKTELNRGEVFYEFERQGDWVLVASSASGLKGWVHGDYLRKTEQRVSVPYVVSGDEINFRASPNIDAVILTALSHGTEVEVLGRNNKWTFIEYSGQQGWMYSEYLKPVGRGTVVPTSPVGERLIARAQAMAGTPYVWGGESDSGVDCSGLIYKLLLEEGADAHGLPRRASTQMAGLGLEVDKENLAPGDLVFFTTYKAGASHVGIYLGDGDFIHASSAQGKVTISNMSEGYYKQRFVGARRITEEELRGLRE